MTDTNVTDQGPQEADGSRATNAGQREADDIPFLQRLYDRPFLLLVLGMAIMLILFTAWGLWEVMTLPEATLP